MSSACPHCGGTMIGDGYTSVRHCEYADPAEDLEPDAAPVYCHPATVRAVDAHSVNCYFCGKLFDERDGTPADDLNGGDGGTVCSVCRHDRATGTTQ